MPAPMASFALHSRRVVTPDGLRDAVVHVEKGSIAAVFEPDAVPPHLDVEDLGDLVLLPGLVDTHVHVNDPGRSDWEGWETATRAAAAGGVTTLVDMPLNSSPVTTSASALDAKRRAADDAPLYCDVGFWGGAVPGNPADLGDLARAGVIGAKAFLCDSGIDEFPASDERALTAAMGALAAHDLPLLVHAELARDDLLDRRALERLPAHDYRSWLEARPPTFEEAAVRASIQLARDTGCRVHIVHLSAASALPLIRRAKDQGLPVTVETCPHYLGLAAEQVARGATWFKCAPPIRSASNREQLWDGLREGLIDFVVSDHSPCTANLKCMATGDFGDAWGGIASLGLSLPIVWAEAQARGFDITDVVRWLSSEPAAFAGLSRKGRIVVGADADLVAWDPDESWKPAVEDLHFKNKLSPWLGHSVRGDVVSTWLRGVRVFERGSHRAATGGEAMRESR
jgi:allantoinase